MRLLSTVGHCLGLLDLDQCRPGAWLWVNAGSIPLDPRGCEIPVPWLEEPKQGLVELLFSADTRPCLQTFGLLGSSQQVSIRCLDSIRKPISPLPVPCWAPLLLPQGPGVRLWLMGMQASDGWLL